MSRMKLIPNHYFDSLHRRHGREGSWIGYWTDKSGMQVGHCVYASTEEKVLVKMKQYRTELA